MTVNDADKIDSSNADNEDSLNLTIGEDEAKIFQDEVSKYSFVVFQTGMTANSRCKFLGFPKFSNHYFLLLFQETDEKVKENNSK